MRTPGRQPRILLTNVKQLERLLTRQHDVSLLAEPRAPGDLPALGAGRTRLTGWRGRPWSPRGNTLDQRVGGRRRGAFRRAAISRQASRRWAARASSPISSSRMPIQPPAPT